MPETVTDAQLDTIRGAGPGFCSFALFDQLIAELQQRRAMSPEEQVFALRQRVAGLIEDRDEVEAARVSWKGHYEAITQEQYRLRAALESIAHYDESDTGYDNICPPEMAMRGIAESALNWVEPADEEPVEPVAF